MPKSKVTTGNIPQHIAIIMDGNGRWAKKRLMPRSFGHKMGMERMVALMEHAFALGVKFVTVYALSTENLKRPQDELDGLFDLIRVHFTKYMERICKDNIRLRILGDISLLPVDVQEILIENQKKTENNDSGGVNIALGYGSRAEIVRAVNTAVEQGEKVTEDSFSALLYTKDIPDPELMIRTGKEIRLSNFLLYQSAYTELYFSKVMFPAFSNKQLEKAIKWYQSRTRRFGKTDEQIGK